MTTPEAPIGLFDSGLGGLTVFREVRRRFPRERLVYLGDTARTPYGSKGPEIIIRYARECARFLAGHEIKVMIVACNTASSVALEVLRSELSCPVIGTIDHAVSSALKTSAGSIGVIGTETTIKSGVYQRELARLSPSTFVTAAACPLFVPLVEHGMIEGKVVDALVEHYLTDLRATGIDTLILGCTHYPLLKPSIDAFFEGKVRLVECSDAIADEVGEILEESKIAAPKGQAGDHSIFVTDAVSPFDRLARTFLGDSMAKVTRVELPAIL